MKTKFLSIISCLTLLISCIISAQSSSPLHIWNDEAEMRPYFTAIQFICQKLEFHIEVEKAANGDIDNCFVSFPSPNSFFNRTPRYLYLETYAYDEKNVKILRLWTPFGEVKLLGSGSAKNLIAFSINFLQKMKSCWHLQEVTNNIKNYTYSNHKSYEEIYDSHSFYQQPWQGSGLQSYLYLIKEVNGHVFVDDQDLFSNELMICGSTHLKLDQIEMDKNLFLRLSQGLNKF